MSAAMFAQMALAGERLATNGAAKRFDSAVQFQMGLAILFAGESLRTHRTRIGPIARVRTHVNVQIPPQRELLATARLRADEFPTLRVNSHVALQIAETRERLIAPVATKWSRTGPDRRHGIGRRRGR